MLKALKTVETKTFQGLRKMYHVLASSLFPLAYLYPPFHWAAPETRKWLLIVSGSCFLVSFILDFLRLRDHKFNSWFMEIFSEFIRRTETNKFNGSTFLCLAFFLVIFLFSRNVSITAMFFLSLGDAAAELGGKNFGRLRIYGKSLEGTLAFFLVAFLIAYFLFENWQIALVGALAGALVELLSFELDDNLTVPIGSALALSFAVLFFHLGSNFFYF
jgi:glycerol-3-phosphate acyltransferase PlsY